MPLRDWWPFRRTAQDAVADDVMEAAQAGPPKIPTRTGFEYGIPEGGIDEYRQGMGAATQTDRRSMLGQLYESYLACPWAWSSVNAISRTITAGGLVTDWDSDDGEGDQEAPDKPANVQALERFLKFCNPREDIRQILRNVVTDLEVFGDAYLEVTWLGGIPVAIYNLDCPSVTPIADAHGTITGYAQVTDYGQRATFEPHEVIHISLDAPRSGVFGVSPTQAALLPITGWLFAASTGKEMFRKGLPLTIHVDFPNTMSPADQSRWLAQYAARNLGPRNLGTPIATKGQATVKELAHGRVADVESYLNQKRDEIIACYGVPPSKIGIIESGNLGGGTGESQDRTFRINTCQPIAELILEKLNYHIAWQGFGVEGWHLKFGDIDMRDSKTVEEIRDMRLRNGSYTLNRLRAEIGEPAVDGGDEPVLIDRQNLVLWRDMESMSQAGIASRLKGTPLEPGEPVPGQAATIEKPEPAPVPDGLKPFAGQDNPAGARPPGPAQDKVPEETWQARHAAYRARLRETYRRLDLHEAA